MASNYPTPTYIKVDVKIDNVLYKDCGARHRGFSTYRYLPSSKRDKRPWKISMDAFVPDQRVQGYRTLNINNNLWDPSFMREVAGYEFMRKFTPASQCCYVKLKVNNEDIGLFVSTQQINKDLSAQDRERPHALGRRDPGYQRAQQHRFLAATRRVAEGAGRRQRTPLPRSRQHHRVAGQLHR
jgi:spore coat protein CotH